MSGFEHALAGGQGAILLPSFHSPDYVPGVSGWAVFKDGSVEFNSGTFRGVVTAGTFEGADFIINQTGAFFYSGTPAAGNLIYSIASASGTDAFGNAYIGPGAVAYGGTGKPYVVMSSDFEGAPSFSLASNRPMEAADGAASLFSFITNQGLANEFLGAFLQGPVANSPNGSEVVVKTFSAANDGSTTAQGSLDYYDNSGTDFTELVWGDGGLILRYVESLTARDPTVSGVPADETWHTMAPLNSGFNLTGAGNYAQYQITPAGKIDIEIFATVTAGPGLTFKQFTTNALPSQYRPVTTKYGMASGNEMAVFTGSNNAGGLVQLATTGQIFVYGIAIGATSIYVSAELPLNFLCLPLAISRSLLDCWSA